MLMCSINSAIISQRNHTKLVEILPKINAFTLAKKLYQPRVSFRQHFASKILGIVESSVVQWLTEPV
jgi:hypothetical protein